MEAGFFVNSPIAWAILFHILGFVFWMGGLLTATQALAGHAVEVSHEGRQALGRLEAKLLTGIAHPGAAITVIAGIVILWLQPSYLREGWLQAKLTLVAILIVMDLMVTVQTRAFHAGRIELKRRRLKVQHGAISATFLAILILVMIKPVALWALASLVFVGVLGLAIDLLPD